jgi:hypothetical protein
VAFERLPTNRLEGMMDTDRPLGLRWPQSGW